jgi:lipoprotein-anchoring transpeptidase ErfK/SrfK
MTSWKSALRRFLLVAMTAVGVAVLAPGAASPGPQDVIAWTAATPSEGAVLGVAAKTQLSVPFGASGPGGAAVTAHIAATGTLPKGSLLRNTDGNPAKATFTWTPAASQAGDYRVTFTATTQVPVSSAQRTIDVRVGPAGRPPPGPPPPPGVFPKQFLFSDSSQETYRWAFVRTPTVARSGPSRAARVVSGITFRTPELYRNAILVLNGVQYRNGEAWVRIRLSVLPNGVTGWVRRTSLTGFQTVHTRMVISRSSLRATLYSYGKPIFRTIVGVGQSQWPTPRGEFYIREKLSGYNAPAYGPRAFGLNARSTKLTDWLGGGFIGIHGTNEPGILPGRVSHGCVRMRNQAILRLFQLMPIGTPVSIH